jgi:radical SAM superfamily enzyme YgiQ (UPF0313 family)
VPSINDGNTVSRQWVRNIDDFATTSVIFTPDTEFGDRYLMEIARGCRWGCRFCLAGFLFRPFRPRSLDHLLAQAENSLRYRKGVGLVAADASDHPDLDELVTRLRHMDAEVSVSSLRIRPLSDVLLQALAESDRQTITLAPEAGSERLRSLINKGVAEKDIYQAVDKVARYGPRQLKLYFMVGLPTETDSDVDEIAKLALALKERSDRRRAGIHIVINIAPFVPKAGTPFQWLPMAGAEILSHRLSRLKSILSPKGIAVKADSVAWSVVQGVLSRGDSRLAPVLASMKEKSLSSWRQTAAECAVDVKYYVNREASPAEKLPWSFLDSGVDPRYLESELAKIGSGEATAPCPPVGCHECGIC